MTQRLSHLRSSMCLLALDASRTDLVGTPTLDDRDAGNRRGPLKTERASDEGTKLTQANACV